MSFIIIENNTNILDFFGEIDDTENISIKKSEYFLVGGYNTNKNKGSIKLFKFNFNYNYKKANIEFLQDINIQIKKDDDEKARDNEEIDDFQAPISCIIQSNITGNILVSCWDGNIYLLTPPNIEMIKNDNPFHILNFLNEYNDKEESEKEEEDDISISLYLKDKKENLSKRKYSLEKTLSFHNYSDLKFNNYYYFEDIMIDIKNIIKKSSITLRSEKDNNKIRFKYDEMNYRDNCKISYYTLQKSKKLNNKENLFAENECIYKSFIGLMKFLDLIKDKIQSNYINKFKLEIKLEFQSHNINELNFGYKIRCIYIFFVPQKKNSVIIYQDDNIFNKAFQGLEFLIKEINDEKYKDLEYEELFNKKYSCNENILDSILSLSTKEKICTLFSLSSEKIKKLSGILSNTNSFSYNSRNSINMFIKFLYQKPSEKTIINYIKIIGNHNSGANNIKILKSNLIISSGVNNEILIYNQIGFKIMELKIGNLDINYEIKIFEKSNKEIVIVIYYRNKIFLISTNLEQKISYFKIYEQAEISFPFFLELCSEWKENNDYKKYDINSLFEKIQNKEFEYGKLLINDSLAKYEKGIIINKNIFIFTYNGGTTDESILIFYNFGLHRIEYNIKGFSFSKLPNGLYMISKEKNKKILFCACQKYFKTQKNGILIVKIDLENGKSPPNYYYYNTHKCQINCFCELKKTVYDKNEHFLLVGGYNNSCKESILKLYKIKYVKPFKRSNIKFLKDITFKEILKNNKNIKNEFNIESFKGYKTPITCIRIDSTFNYLFISFFNGDVCLFSPPNLDSF